MLGLGLGINKNNSIISKFVSTWKTDNLSTGSSNNNQVKLPTVASGTYNCHVSWGDGNTDHITAYNQAEVTHTYSSIGTYEVKIKGVFSGFKFNDSGDKLKLLTIDRWGKNFNLGDNDSVFYGCSNLQILATDVLDTSMMTNMSSMFRDCSSLNQDINFDTSNVTDMSLMFYGCSSFNKSVNFDTSNVTNMSSMFRDCSVFDQSVNFDTSNVTNMYLMFSRCRVFNQSVSNFNTSNVTNMKYMFNDCNVFNQSVSNFNTSNVTDMGYMFRDCNAFNQSVSNFNTSNVTDMSYMFRGCNVFNQSVSNFDISSVTTISSMLLGATSWSTANYDAFLVSASSQTVNSGLQFDCSSNYTLGGAAEAARNDLINNDLWTINDLGGV